jgi:hypothetical protein
MNYPASVPINYSNNAYFYPDDTGVLGSFTKAPDAKTLVSLDYTSILSELNMNLQSISYVLNYGSAPQLLVSGTTIEANNNIVSFIVSGGLNGLKYVLQVNALMSDGQTVNVQYLEVVVSAPGTRSGNCDPAVYGSTGVGGPPISTIYQQASILNGDNTKFGSTFIVFWVSDTAPTTANILDRWYNTSDGLIYDRATDGNSVFWVSSAQRPTQYTTGANAPTGPQVGDMWFNTGTNVLSIWINTGSGLNWFVI